MRTETVFSIKELRYVAIKCQYCATEVILDMTSYERKLPPSPERPSFAPRQCPACRLPYDTAIGALDDLQRAYAALSKLNGVITFRAEASESR